jgi:iron complex outermembrane receptor protein
MTLKFHRAGARPGPKPSLPSGNLVNAGIRLAFVGGFAALSAPVFAQSQPGDAPPQQLDRVTITGSNIRRIDAETPSPVQVITADDMKKSGYTTVSQVLSSITANGQGTLSQNFSQAFASGGSGVALRGLTVGATLVLIDGHRMAPYPIGDDGQRSFVDISNIPFDAVERIEVLKDGASAVYGSDAIAGVVNVILKRSFVGKTFTIDTGTSTKGDGTTYHLAGTVGFGDLSTDGHNFYVAGEYRHQDQITFADRGGLYTQTDFTGQGGDNLTLGVPNGLNGGLPRSATGYVVDPNGGTAPAGFMPGCDATKFAAGQCTYSNNWSQIQPKTDNINLLARYTQNLTADWQLSLQGSYLESKSQQILAPSHTFSDGYQGLTSGPGVIPTLLTATGPTTIPSTNPSFPTGTGLSSGNLYYTFLGLGPTITNTDAKSTRLIADLQGHVGAWDLTGSAGYTEVRLGLTGTGYVVSSLLQAALDSTTDPYLVGGANSAAMNASIAPTLNTTDTSKLSFLHVGATRDLLDLSGGPLSVALGADYMHRAQYAVAPAEVAAGLIDSFSNNFTIGTQNVASAYAELAAPFTKQLEGDLAIRYDHYNLSGGKASPKVGFKYQAIPELAFRGTASRGFRAPGPAENGTAGQTYFAGTTNDPILCPTPTNVNAPGNFPSQCSISPATVQGTNPALKPETSSSYTLGLVFAPTKDISATIDYYAIQINNQIVTEPSTDYVRGSNFSPLPFVNPDGSISLKVPSMAPIAYSSVIYINANKTSTSGFDVDLQYHHRFEGVGTLKSDFMVTYMNKYDQTIDGVTYHLAGTHGPAIVSGDTGSPTTRIQWINTLSRGPWDLTGTLNYISSFDLTDPSSGVTDCASGVLYGGSIGSQALTSPLSAGTIPPGVSCKVAAFTTFDVSGKYAVNNQLTLTGSILNLFNAGAPADWGTYGGGGAPYNPSLHSQGAIGRYFTVGATYTF